MPVFDAVASNLRLHHERFGRIFNAAVAVFSSGKFKFDVKPGQLDISDAFCAVSARQSFAR